MQGYRFEQLDCAKTLLYDLCADKENKTDRKTKRQGTDKKLNTLKDIIDMITRKCNNDTFPRFVAHDLSKLPEVSFSSIDVCSLLSRMETMQKEIELLKSTVGIQNQVCNDIKDMFVESKNDLKKSELQDPTQK